MDRETFTRELAAALTNSAGREARSVVVEVVGAAIGGVGSRLQFSGFFGNEPDRGVALVASMGGALASGARVVLDDGNAYAAAALVRQVVEVEYLLWTFSDDPEDATRWLKASKSELWKRYRPKAMRDRSGGKFRSSEYAAHCDRGGHPSPRGWDLVIEDAYVRSAGLPHVDGTRLDLAQHLSRAWSLLVSACDAIERSPVYSTYVHDVERAVQVWLEADRAALELLAEVPLSGEGQSDAPASG